MFYLIWVITGILTILFCLIYDIKQGEVFTKVKIAQAILLGIVLGPVLIGMVVYVIYQKKSDI